MLKSRRGLLAAGLAVAVAGAFGVASTLQADADQIAPPTAAEKSAAVEAPPTPPATLPWGDRPKPIKRGKAGASAKSLRTAGLAAAANDTSGSVVAKPKEGPKGRFASLTDQLTTETTDIAPPEPPSDDDSDADQKVHYLYNVGAQAAVTDGVHANVTISKPKLEESDYHTLAELALQSGDKKQIVEVGWTVDRVVNGDDDPHLFVYHWVDKKSTCYNACGFQQYSANIKPGDTLPQDTVKKFGIQYFKNAWWIAYDSEWVGFFPESLWNKEGITFNKSGLIQVFGEVASTTTTPCWTQMGNGKKPKMNGSAAKLASVTYVNTTLVPELAIRTNNPAYKPYNAPTTLRTFQFGGPGPCEPKDPEDEQ
ncbi:neprosin family prolyl endopeptidase [Actinoplanes sp. NPDC049596]|uniref:neprosin family prolyl endopeptidase n=1 Tax=unclassified Actinoplanes TaxID=2626549 RepID=UPI00341DD794